MAIEKFASGQSFVISVNAQTVVEHRDDLEALGGGATIAKIPRPVGPAGMITFTGRRENGIMISSEARKSENFVAMMQFIDWLWYSPEGKMFAKWGVEGVTYTGSVEDGTFQLAENVDWAGLNPGADELLNADYGFFQGSFVYGGSTALLQSQFPEEEKEFQQKIAGRESPWRRPSRSRPRSASGPPCGRPGWGPRGPGDAQVRTRAAPTLRVGRLRQRARAPEHERVHRPDQRCVRALPRGARLIHVPRQSTGRLTDAWRNCVGTGRLDLALRQDYQESLALVQREIGFRHIRGHGLLSDGMGVYRPYEYQGTRQVRYAFTYVDQVIDAYLRLGIAPFLELGFMPSGLASGDQTVFWWRGNVTPPRSWTGWADLVRATVAHLVDRYGIDQVRHWPIEVWNEPNLKDFWQGADQAAYHRLYEVTAHAVKEVDAVAAGRRAGHLPGYDEWLERFAEFVV